MTTVAQPDGLTVPAPARTPSPTTEPTPAVGQAEGRLMPAISGVAIAAAIVVGLIGFVVSFSTLSAQGQAWGFGRLSPLFPIGVDAGIVMCLALDLHMARKGTPWPVLRLFAHGLTALTVYLNGAAQIPAGASLWDHLGRVVAHAAMPVLFVIAAEATRRRVIALARLEMGVDTIPMDRWVLAPWPTFKLFRRMRLWDVRSYAEAVEREQALLVYRVWLKHREENGTPVTALDRLPFDLAPYGYSVEQALAVPDEMRADEEAREQAAADRARHAELRAKHDKAQANLDELRLRGMLQKAEAELSAETGVAQADAAAATATAEARAAQARASAEQIAEESKRRAAAEAAAEDSAAAAEARARAAEAEAHEAAERARAADADKRAAEADQAAAEARRDAAEADEATAEAARRTALLRAEEEAAKATAAEARTAALEAEKRAVEAEDLLRLTPTQRDARKVARAALAKADGDAMALPLSDVVEILRGVSEGTASKRRAEAAELIADGYRG